MHISDNIEATKTDNERGYMNKKILSLFLIFTMLFTILGVSAPDADAKSRKTNKYKWSEKLAPNYVVKIGKAKVKAKPKRGKIKYSKLDKFGRTRRVRGNITYKMVKRSAGWRAEFAANSDPSGWGENKIVKIKLYNGRQYKGYLWNRSHLIADSLGGKAIRKNLITGTRTQNVGANDGRGGMAYTERKVVNYLYKHHKVSVYYSADPIYRGKEIVPRSVIVDVRSSDKKLNERVIVYNAAKGFKINYRKGMAKQKEARETQSPSPNSDDQSKVYVTRSGKRYHLSRECSGLVNAAAIYETTKAEAIARGKTLCQICEGNQ